MIIIKTVPLNRILHLFLRLGFRKVREKSPEADFPGGTDSVKNFEVIYILHVKKVWIPYQGIKNYYRGY